MATLENCPHSPAVMALLADVRHQLTQRIPAKQDVLGWDLSALNADDLTFLNTLLGEVSCAFSMLTAGRAEFQGRFSAVSGGCVVRMTGQCRNIWKQVARHELWRAATINTLPDDSLLPPPIDRLMNGLTGRELLAHVRSGNATQH